MSYMTFLIGSLDIFCPSIRLNRGVPGGTYWPRRMHWTLNCTSTSCSFTKSKGKSSIHIQVMLSSPRVRTRGEKHASTREARYLLSIIAPLLLNDSEGPQVGRWGGKEFLVWCTIEIIVEVSNKIMAGVAALLDSVALVS